MPKINANRKGKEFERWVANFFKRWYPDARRQTYDQARRGSEVPDIILSGERQEVFWIEVKHRQKVTKGMVGKWLRRAVDDSIKYSKWAYPPKTIIIFKDDSRRTYGKDGCSHIRLIMYRGLLKNLEEKAKYCDRSETEFHPRNPLIVELTPQYFSDLFDFAFGVAPKK